MFCVLLNFTFVWTWVDKRQTGVCLICQWCFISYSPGTFRVSLLLFNVVAVEISQWLNVVTITVTLALFNWSAKKKKSVSAYIGPHGINGKIPAHCVNVLLFANFATLKRLQKVVPTNKSIQLPLACKLVPSGEIKFSQIFLKAAELSSRKNKYIVNNNLFTKCYMAHGK